MVQSLCTSHEAAVQCHSFEGAPHSDLVAVRSRRIPPKELGLGIRVGGIEFRKEALIGGSYHVTIVYSFWWISYTELWKLEEIVCCGTVDRFRGCVSAWSNQRYCCCCALIHVEYLKLKNGVPLLYIIVTVKWLTGSCNLNWKDTKSQYHCQQ